MAAVLHLLAREPGPVARETIRQQLAAGDRVEVVRLPGVATSAVAGVVSRAVPDDLDYAGLLDLIFAVDQVIAW